mgnify:CR=1 FL=1
MERSVEYVCCKSFCPKKHLFVDIQEAQEWFGGTLKRFNATVQQDTYKKCR